MSSTGFAVVSRSVSEELAPLAVFKIIRLKATACTNARFEHETVDFDHRWDPLATIACFKIWHANGTKTTDRRSVDSAWPPFDGVGPGTSVRFV